MENNNEIYTQDEINLKEVLGQALKSWRKFLAVGLVFALFLGMYKFVPAMNIYKDDEKSAKYISRNDSKIAYLQKNVEDLEYEVDKQEEYFNNSIYLNINPLYVQKGTISYYISTPKTGSEYDYAEDVVHAYKNLFSSGELVDEVVKRLSYDVEARYISEIVQVEMISTDKDDKKLVQDLSNNYIDITITHSDYDKLQEIMDIVKQIIKEKGASIRTEVGEYSISLVSFNTSVVTDEDIKTKRTELDTALDTLESTLDTKKSELKSAENSYISRESIGKNTVIFALIGFVLGIVVSLACAAVYIILSGRIISGNQLRTSKGVVVLGDFVKKRKKFNKLDKAACKLVGENVDDSYEDVLKVSAYNMVSFTDKKSIVLMDLVGNEFSAETADKLKSFDFAKSKEFICGNETLDKFEILEKLGPDTAVVLVAKKLGTKVGKLDRELSIIKSYNSEFVGIVLV